MLQVVRDAPIRASFTKGDSGITRRSEGRQQVVVLNVKAHLEEVTADNLMIGYEWMSRSLSSVAVKMNSLTCFCMLYFCKTTLNEGAALPYAARSLMS